MLRLLLSKLRHRPASGDLPEDLRIYAVGDIHGRDDLLAELHGTIARDLDERPCAGEALLIHLGDYVDRGPRSREVLDRLASAPPPGIHRALHLMGNHEELMLAFLRDAKVGRAWLQLGGDATLASYGVSLTPDVPPAERFEALRENFAAALPAEHLGLLESLQLHYRVGGYLFVHAGILPGRSLDRQRPEHLLWIRDEFTRSQSDHGAMVIHGHHMQETVQEHPNRIGIDTGAYHSGVLTALVLEADHRRYLATGGA